MPALTGAGTKRIARFTTEEFQFFLRGFEYVPQHRTTKNEHYETLIDTDGVDGYIESTPATLTPAGYEETWPYRSHTGEHVDKFRTTPGDEAWEDL
ncbi:MAG: hypothetical protein A3K19_00575 [Lentisphaerae bacterium RIFOXYB12_FULL_65_16]|nr:MAG: hypothetical protein A3K18_14935 [Lentisphaerae bacterium RIFOXYA12_64_32]OGV86784.1 MAG: hypothetical protein A3K19_00575 [Lentisphaerae bacterium RIFOXYB12_FULL_65_16]